MKTMRVFVLIQVEIRVKRNRIIRAQRELY
jgi:hypothetical protein